MRWVPVAVLSKEVLMLLASPYPSDRVILERRLATLPRSVAADVLFQIASLMVGKQRVVVQVKFILSILTLILSWIIPSLFLSKEWSIVIPLLAFVCVFWGNIRDIAFYVRHQRAREAVFYLARLNDVRAIELLLQFRRKRMRDTADVIFQEKIEVELTRLFDELTGTVYIPGDERFRQLISREYRVFARKKREVSKVRTYFYIAMLRCLTTQQSTANTECVIAVEQLKPWSLNSQLVHEAAHSLLSPDGQGIIRRRTSYQTPLAALQSLRRQ